MQPNQQDNQNQQRPDLFEPSAPQGPAQQPSGQVPPQGQPQSASQLKGQKPWKWIIAVTVLSLALIGALIWGFMMMQSRNDYRDNTQQKIDEAVGVALEEQQAELEAEFKEREKEPLVNYTGPSEFGTVSIDYPKTWSAYVDEEKSGNTPIDGYFHPSYVPGVDSGISFALRLEVLESPYNEELDDYSNAAEDGEVEVSPITLEKVPDVSGSRIDGLVERDKRGSVVLFPVRDKTIKVSVLTDTFIKDFNNIILKNMSFVP